MHTGSESRLARRPP